MPQIAKDDLLTALFTYAPREGCKPKENFCTEALVWCLQNSPQFRRSFLGIVIPKQAAVEEEWLFESQVGIKLPDGQQRYLDVYATSQSSCLVIECKVESRVRLDQLREYGGWLDTQSPVRGKFPLICLTKRQENTPVEVVPIRWKQIYTLLGSESQSDGSVGFVARCFMRFLKEHGMAPKTLEKLPTGGTSSLQQCHRFWKDVDLLLNSFRSDEDHESLQLNKPRSDEDEAFFFQGVYSRNEKYYAGVGLSLMDDAPAAFLWVEFTLKGDQTSLRKRFSANAYEAHLFAESLRKYAHKNGAHSEPYTFAEADSETYFAFAVPFDQFDGKASAVLDWWGKMTFELLPLFKGVFVP